MKTQPKIRDMPSVDRPREKLKAKGPQNLKDPELLAILLGTGYKGKNVLQLAKSVLSKYCRKKLLNLTYDELIKNHYPELFEPDGRADNKKRLIGGAF